MKKILFLHGFFASGNCELALTLSETLKEKADVFSPDIPINPKMALDLIQTICDREKIDLLVGNSCGAFYAQIYASICGKAALLGNPHFRMTEFLGKRKGEHMYKTPRMDGKQNLLIDERLIMEFYEMENEQFKFYKPQNRDRIWGIFGENDTVVNCEREFLEYYPNSFHFPGAHTPTSSEVKMWYIPLIEQMIAAF